MTTGFSTTPAQTATGSPTEARAAVVRKALARDGGTVRQTTLASGGVRAERKLPSGRTAGQVPPDVVALGLREGWLVKARTAPTVATYELAAPAEKAKPAPKRERTAQRVTRRTVARKPSGSPAANAKPQPKAPQPKAPQPKAPQPKAPKPKAPKPAKPKASKYRPRTPLVPPPTASGDECVTVEQAVERWGCTPRQIERARSLRRVDVGPRYRVEGRRGTSLSIALTTETLAYAQAVWVEGDLQHGRKTRRRALAGTVALPPMGSELLQRELLGAMGHGKGLMKNHGIGRALRESGAWRRPSWDLRLRLYLVGPELVGVLEAEGFTVEVAPGEGQPLAPPPKKPRKRSAPAPVRRYGPELPTSPHPVGGAESLTMDAVAERYGATLAAVRQALVKGRVDRGGTWRAPGRAPSTSVAMTTRTCAYAQATWVEGRKLRNPKAQQTPRGTSNKRLPASPEPMPDGTPCEELGAIAERYGRKRATVLDAVLDGHLDRGTLYRPDGTTGRGRTSVAMTPRSIEWMDRAWTPPRVELERGAWLMQKDLVAALGYAKMRPATVALFDGVPQRRDGRARLYLAGEALVEAARSVRIEVALTEPASSGVADWAELATAGAPAETPVFA